MGSLGPQRQKALKGSINQLKLSDFGSVDLIHEPLALPVSSLNIRLDLLFGVLVICDFCLLLVAAFL